MRPMEGLLFLATFAALVANVPLPRPRLVLALCGLGLGVALLQALLEGARWQLVPTWLILAPMGALSLRVLLKPEAPQPPRWLHLVATGSGLLLVGLGALLAWALPVFHFDKPTGPYAVGTTSFDLTDMRRPEPLSDEPGAHRALVVRMWYPAAASDKAAHAQYMASEVAQGLARSMRLPGFLGSHLALVSTHAIPEAPVAPSPQPFPVLLFSHGLGGLVNQNTYQLEELASHGYVVVGINHTYDSALTLFKDGRAVPFKSPGELWRNEKLLEPRLQAWVEDARGVLNQLTTLERADGRFTGRLDLERVGYFGHSFGGAAALATLAADERIRAGLNMDGDLFGAAVEARPSRPFMLMTGQHADATDAQLQQLGMTRQEFTAYTAGIKQRWQSVLEQSARTYHVSFQGVDHMGFSDLPLLAPLLYRKPPPARHAHRLVNDYTRAFFDTHLKGAASPLLQQPATDPAVTLTVRTAPPADAAAR